MNHSVIDQALIQWLNDIAKRAGEAILAVYEQSELGIETKSDATPVTRADMHANAVIEAGLQLLPEQYPILSEESVHASFDERRDWSRYWLVDPLDGTQEFINRNGEFSVNIGLIENSYPLFGMVYIPATNTSYWGGKELGAFRQKDNQLPVAIHPRTFNPEQDVVVLGSRSYGTDRAKAYLKQLQSFYSNLEFNPVGSALKSCFIADGQADIYPRIGPTSEWDTGAVQAVVEGAGGLFLNPEGERFSYNRKESLVNSDFLVIGDTSINWRAFWNKDFIPD